MSKGRPLHVAEACWRQIMARDGRDAAKVGHDRTNVGLGGVTQFNIDDASHFPAR